MRAPAVGPTPIKKSVVAPLLSRFRKLTVDPVLVVPHARDDTRSKRASWVQASTGVVHSDHLSDEKRKTDSDGSHESGFVLLVGKHEDGEDKLGCQDCFDLRNESADATAVLGAQQNLQRHRGLQMYPPKASFLR